MLYFNYIGFSNGQGYIHQGMRWSTAEGYLQPAMERPNLSVAIQSNVRRVCGCFTEHGGFIKYVAEIEMADHFSVVSAK